MSENSQKSNAPAATRIEEARRLFQEGVALLKWKKPAEAMERLRRAVQLRPVFPDAYKALALVFKARGDARRARRALFRAAEAFVLEERFEEACNLARDLRQVEPDLPDPFVTAAATLEANSRHHRAARVLELAIVHVSDDPLLHCALARNLAAAGHKEKALATLEGAWVLLEGFDEAQALFRQLGGQRPRSSAATGEPVDPQEEDTVTIEVFQTRERVEPPAPERAAGARGRDQDPVTIVRFEAQPRPDRPEDAGDGSPDSGPGDESSSAAHFVDHRRAERISLADYFVRLSRFKPPHPVVNLSTGGIAFKVDKARIGTGDKVGFDLMALDEVKIRKLRAEIRHISAGVAGCRFVELSERQQNAIETVIRKMQFPDDAVDTSSVDFNLELW